HGPPARTAPAGAPPSVQAGGGLACASRRLCDRSRPHAVVPRGTRVDRQFRPGRELAPPLELQETFPDHVHPWTEVEDRYGPSPSELLVDPVDDLWGGVLAERRDSVGETHVVVTTGRNPEGELARHVARQEVSAQVVHEHRGNRQIGLEIGVPFAERPLQFGEERTLDQVVDAECPAASLSASRPLRL